MNKDEQQYLDLLKELLDSEEKDDRTGVGTLSKFGHTMRFSLENDTLPLLTTKKVFFRGIFEELAFFIRGERDTKKLEAKGVSIWSGNTSREFLDKRGLYDYEEGDMGPLYGHNWRHFGSLHNYGVDQLQNAFNEIKNNPTSRRIVVTALDPSTVDKCVLWPCHLMFQFNVRGDKLDCMWVQRSVDCAIGFPYNVCSYAILTHIMAKATGLKPGDLVFSGGDVHLYKTHIEGAKEQITREPYPFPKLKINKDIKSITDMENLQFENFELIDYKHHPAIKLEMAI